MYWEGEADCTGQPGCTEVCGGRAGGGEVREGVCQKDLMQTRSRLMRAHLKTLLSLSGFGLPCKVGWYFSTTFDIFQNKSPDWINYNTDVTQQTENAMV